MRDLLLQNLVHVGYFLMLCALVARDILWLRGILVVSQSLLAVYALYRGIYSIAGWNVIFVLINTAWVIRILRERAAVQLPPELKVLHEQHFAALTPAEFLRLWQWGERRTLHGTRLVAQGQNPDTLFFLLRGEAIVRISGREVARLHSGAFVAEMSLLTGEKTSADVWAGEELELMAWPTDRLRQVRQRNPMLWARIQSVLGHDLVEKLKRATTITNATPVHSGADSSGSASGGGSSVGGSAPGRNSSA